MQRVSKASAGEPGEVQDDEVNSILGILFRACKQAIKTDGWPVVELYRKGLGGRSDATDLDGGAGAGAERGGGPGRTPDTEPMH